MMSRHVQQRRGKDVPTVNPEMILLGRYSRGITQAELAQRLNVSQARVSKMENGVMSPTEQDLEGLCVALDYPPTFFKRRWVMEGPGIHEMHHRKRKSVAASLLNQVYAKASIQREQVGLLLQSSDSIDHAFQAFDIQEFDGKVSRIARTVHAMWRLPLGPVHNVTKTIERAGGFVLITDFGTKQIDGISTWPSRLPPIFWLNKDLPPDRWRWTLVHELGHILMHSRSDVRDEMEAEADQFAAEFLIPAAEIKPHLVGLSLSKLAALKRQWKVSMQALIMQAYHLGVISDRQRRHMFMQLSRAGYRMREPAELDPPPELPARVNELIRFHQTELGYTEAAVQELLGVYERDLDDLVPGERPLLRMVK